jgi:hypothetical protein
MIALDIITTALVHLRVHDPAEPVANENAATCVKALRSILDAWQLDPFAVIGRQEVTRTPLAGVQTFTIGAAGDISTVGLPNDLEFAFYRLNNVDVPIELSDLSDYESRPSKTVQGPPQLIAYERNQTLGTVYLYPASNGQCEIHLWVNQSPIEGYASLTGATTLTLAPGYQNALEWVLAEEVASGFAVPPDVLAVVRVNAARAMRRLKRSNLRMGELKTPVIAHRRYFNIYTG